MSRPPKRGLAYFTRDVDYYQDEKIIELAMRYGPLGLTTFDVLLTIIYREGYYILASASKAAALVARTVGVNWYKKHGICAIDFITEIIQGCAEIGLLNASLLRQDVITSVGIQRRYAAVTARNKVDKSKYWLLDNDSTQAACESMPKSGISATETPINVTETLINAAEMQQIKENKIKENISIIDRACAREENEEIEEVIEVSFGEVEAKFKNILPNLELGASRAQIIKAIMEAKQPLSYYDMLFERAARSTFLVNGSKSGWKCTLAWLLEPSHSANVISGKYDNRLHDRAGSSHTTVNINGAESGFDTDEFFKAALERGQKG